MMEISDTELQSLRAVAAKQACQELVFKLARSYDRLDREMILSVFHEDAHIDYANYQGGPPGLVDMVVNAVTKMKKTQHCISNVDVRVVGDRAVSECYFIAHHQEGENGDEFMLVSGRYLDSFERRAGVWKMSGRKAVMEFRYLIPYLTPEPVGPRSGVRSHEDWSYAHLASV